MEKLLNSQSNFRKRAKLKNLIPHDFKTHHEIEWCWHGRHTGQHDTVQEETHKYLIG